MVINVSASDNIGISRVEFFIDGGLFCTDNAVPYQCSWYVPKKVGVNYSIRATAYDLAGNFSSDSIIVTSR